MKTSQKGFVIPLLLGIVALLLIGGGVYMYTQKPAENTAPSISLTMQAKAEPNQVSSGGRATISWSSVGATGCYLSSPSEKRNEIGISGSGENVIYSKFLPIKITCYDDSGNEVSTDLDLTIKS